jgi:hypothetical protein
LGVKVNGIAEENLGSPSLDAAFGPAALKLAKLQSGFGGDGDGETV